MFQRYTNEELWERANRRHPSPSVGGPLAVLGIFAVIALVILAVVLLGPSGTEGDAVEGDPLTSFLMKAGHTAGTRCYECEEGTAGTPWSIPDTRCEAPCR